MELLGTGKQRAAKTSRVLIGTQTVTGGTALCYASWNIIMTGEDFVTVNFESYNTSAGVTYDEGIIGKVSAQCSYGGDWDAGTNPLGSPPGLYVRDDLQNVAMVVDRLDSTLWAFPYQRVRSAKNSGEIAGKVLFSIDDAKNQGPFTFPTANA